MTSPPPAAARLLARALALALLLVVAAAEPAAGQVPLHRFDELFRPDYLRRDLAVIGERLELDEPQRLVLETLFEDYETELRQRADEVRQELRGLEPRGDDSEQLQEQRRDVSARMRELAEAYRASASQELSAEQRRALRERFQEKFQTLRDRMRDLRPSPPDPAEMKQYMDEVTRITGAWQREREEMTARFVADLMGQLTEGQQARWPEVQRRLRRHKSLPRGRMAGESVDLIRMLERLELEPDEHGQIEALLERYERSLDEALRRRDQHLTTSQMKRYAAIRQRDADDALPIMLREIDLRVAVRDLNFEYAHALVEALPDEAAEAFGQRMRRTAFPRVHRPTRAQRVFEAAEQIEGVDPEAAEAIAAIRQSYLQELTAANERLRDVIRHREPEQLRLRNERLAARMLGERSQRQPDPVREEFVARRDLGEHYLEQMYALLTPQQREQLPRRSEQRQLRGATRDDRDGDADQHQAQRPARSELLRRFDVNGDGRLDPDERREMIESLRRDDDG